MVGRLQWSKPNEGTAAFEEPMHVWAGGELIEGERILICTGARTLIPPIEGLNTVDYLTSTTALQMKELPVSLIIAGGGPIAVEFDQMYARFGVDVTILQRPARLVPNVDYHRGGCAKNWNEFNRNNRFCRGRRRSAAICVRSGNGGHQPETEQ